MKGIIKGLLKLFSKPLILASFCTVVAGMVAGGTTLLLVRNASSESHEEQVKEEVHATEKLMYPLGDFTVNLVDADRYLRTSIQLEIEVFSDPNAKLAEENSENGGGHGGGHGSGKESNKVDPRLKEITERLPAFKDGLIEIISSFKFQELLTVEGKRRLKTELIDMFNDRCKSAKVVNIFFTTFTMQ
ncbi:MAG: flagellar basal body-associated FliL family protein [Planctomycetes bacterium]|nr:flagellar basal body-associated FliL family protein [Planctomycetota bacterium]